MRQVSATEHSPVYTSIRSPSGPREMHQRDRAITTMSPVLLPAAGALCADTELPWKGRDEKRSTPILTRLAWMN